MQDNENNRFIHTGPYLKHPIHWIPESELIQRFTEAYRLFLQDDEHGLAYYPWGNLVRIIVIKGK